MVLWKSKRQEDIWDDAKVGKKIEKNDHLLREQQLEAIVKLYF